MRGAVKTQVAVFAHHTGLGLLVGVPLAVPGLSKPGGLEDPGKLRYLEILVEILVEL